MNRNPAIRQIAFSRIGQFLRSCLIIPLAFASGAFAAPGSGVASAGQSSEEIRIFKRQWEPNERAFSFLCPQGWSATGGIFHVNPLEAGGPGNSLVSKCDLTLKRDAAGTVYLRWLPSYNHADFSRNPQAAFSASMFPAGSRYQGMLVRPMPGWEAFLMELFRQLHPAAADVEVVEKEALPELARIYETLCQSVNQMMVGLGLAPMTFQAGGIVLGYEEGGRRYRQALITALVDNRGGALMWSNEYTLAIRAPAGEADQWKPVLDVLRQSIRFNLEWVARAAAAARDRGRIVEETFRQVQRIDQEIWENRSRTHTANQYEGYLLLTGQEDYVNPFSREVETDTQEFKHRWTNANGDYIYSNSENYDPNKISELNQVEWKTTPVRKR